MAVRRHRRRVREEGKAGGDNKPSRKAIHNNFKISPNKWPRYCRLADCSHKERRGRGGGRHSSRGRVGKSVTFVGYP
jgi:hypothetical protein